MLNKSKIGNEIPKPELIESAGWDLTTSDGRLQFVTKLASLSYAATFLKQIPQTDDRLLLDTLD